jgi:hypothetical protein
MLASPEYLAFLRYSVYRGAVAKDPMKKRTKDKPLVSSGSTGQDIKLRPLTGTWKPSIRGILKDLVRQHSTEIAMRAREGLLSKNLRLALKFQTLAAAYVDGKPVETHRMVSLEEGPSGAYDLTKLNAEQQKDLLLLLRQAKDTTEPSSNT